MHVQKIVKSLAVLLVTLILVPAPPPVSAKNAISYNKEGWEQLRRGDAYRAIFSFKNALKENARYLEAIHGLARAYAAVEGYDQAVDLYVAALKLEPNSSAINEGMGVALAARGDYAEALASFTKAVKLSGENVDAEYGIAWLYEIMGRRIWAKRKLEGILRLHPFHTDSLLLMASIRSREGRMADARRLVEKAIEAQGDSAKCHVAYGEILLGAYLASEEKSFLDEAAEALANALSIQPAHYEANRLMGSIALLRGDAAGAIPYFEKALTGGEGGMMYYDLALACDGAGNTEMALSRFLEAIKARPADSILRARLEDFLVLRDFKIGHPARVMLNQENQELARTSVRRSLPESSTLYLRRALLLNPMDRESREQLMDYYKTMGYHPFYIDELKEILRLYPEKKYTDLLQIEIIRRRDRLYHVEGYSSEPPPRDVPRLLVLDFDSRGVVSPHFDAGRVIAQYLTFAMGQFGRMEAVGLRKRDEAAAGLRTGNDHIADSLEAIAGKIKAGELPQVDYIVYGDYTEHGSFVAVNCRILDYYKGFIVNEFAVSREGKESLPALTLRLARNIYEHIPYRGKILKIKEQGVVVNLGTWDGLQAGDRLMILKRASSLFQKNLVSKRIFLVIKEADTLVSYAEPLTEADFNEIDSDDYVYPVQHRRARRLAAAPGGGEGLIAFSLPSRVRTRVVPSPALSPVPL